MQTKSRIADPSRQVIVLSPEKASDFEGELPALADVLTEAFSDLSVEVRNPLKGPPGALPSEAVEVLTVIWPLAVGYAFNKAADLIIGKLRAGSKAQKDEPQVRLVKIYCPTGEILRQVRIPGDESETEDD
jgi:hypothetical protein